MTVVATMILALDAANTCYDGEEPSGDISHRRKFLQLLIKGFPAVVGIFTKTTAIIAELSELLASCTLYYRLSII